MPDPVTGWRGQLACVLDVLDVLDVLGALADMPLLLVWGSHDRTIPVVHRAIERHPAARLITLERVGP